MNMKDKNRKLLDDVLIAFDSLKDEAIRNKILKSVLINIEKW